jgi:hypothetical protein
MNQDDYLIEIRPYCTVYMIGFVENDENVRAEGKKRGEFVGEF